MTPATSSLALTPLADRQARAYVFRRMAEEGRARIVQYHLPEPSLDAWLEHTAPERAWFCTLSGCGPLCRDASSGFVSGLGHGPQESTPRARNLSSSPDGKAFPQLYAAVWINNFTGKAAFVHFVIFRGFEHLARHICHSTCRWAFSGGLACLLGLIPAVNRAALAAMRACGWQEIFRVPQACFVHRLGRHVDGVLCHFTPQLLHEAIQ